MAYMASMPRSVPGHSNGYRMAGAAAGLGPGLKKCGHCQEIKDAVEFSADASRGDGLRGWCKSCEAEARSKRYKKRKAASETQPPKRRQTDMQQNSRAMSGYLRARSPYSMPGAQHSQASPWANSDASAALENAAAVRQELLAAYNQQLQLQAAQAQSPQLAVQMALIRAAAQLQGDPGISAALGGMSLPFDAQRVPSSQGYPGQSTPAQLAALELMRQQAAMGQLGSVHGLAAQQPWTVAIKQEPPHTHFAVGSPQTSDSELSAVESLTGMKRDKSGLSPGKGGISGFTPTSARGLQSSSVTTSARPGGLSLTAALAEAAQQRQSARDGTAPVSLTCAPGSDESALSSAASAVATAQQHQLINDYLVSMGQAPLAPAALDAILSSLPASKPPQTNAAAATSVRSLSAPAAHTQAQGPSHPAIGGLLTKLPSFNSSSTTALPPRDTYALFDSVPRRARTPTDAIPAAQLSPKSSVDQQTSTSAALAALLSHVPACGVSDSLNSLMDGKSSLDLGPRGAPVHRPVPTVPLPVPVTGIQAAGVPFLSEQLSRSPPTVQVDASVQQAGEPAAWLAEVSLLLLALRAVGFARAAQ